MALGDLTNDYHAVAQEALGEKTPKTVFSALAFSLAMRLSGDNAEQAAELLRSEWRALHAAGIVPQKPSKEAR
jgi:hypothetical protein